MQCFIEGPQFDLYTSVNEQSMIATKHMIVISSYCTRTTVAKRAPTNSYWNYKWFALGIILSEIDSCTNLLSLSWLARHQKTPWKDITKMSECCIFAKSSSVYIAFWLALHQFWEATTSLFTTAPIIYLLPRRRHHHHFCIIFPICVDHECLEILCQYKCFAEIIIVHNLVRNKGL